MSTGSIRHSQRNVPSVRTAAADVRVHGGWSVWGGGMGTRYVNCCTLLAVLDVCHIATIPSYPILSYSIPSYSIPSYSIPSYPILSYPILFYPIFYPIHFVSFYPTLYPIPSHPILASRLVMEAFKHVPVSLQKPLWRLRVGIMSKQGKNVLGEC